LKNTKVKGKGEGKSHGDDGNYIRRPFKFRGGVPWLREWGKGASEKRVLKTKGTERKKTKQNPGEL